MLAGVLASPNTIPTMSPRAVARSDVKGQLFGRRSGGAEGGEVATLAVT